MRSLPPKISSDLASHIVQVTREAKANPIITAFTMMSAAMNMPHGDKSCGRFSSIAPAGAAPTSAAVAGWPPGCAGAIVAGAGAAGVAGSGATRAGAVGAAGGAAGASAAGAESAGCSWAVALPPARITDATNAANKPCLDKSFFLIVTAASRFLFPAASAYCT